MFVVTGLLSRYTSFRDLGCSSNNVDNVHWHGTRFLTDLLSPTLLKFILLFVVRLVD
jgi:hypothetical protein